MKSIHNKAYRQMLDLLRSKRIEKGVTQEKLALLIGVAVLTRKTPSKFKT